MKQLWYRAVLIFAFSIAVVGGGYFLTALDDRMALRVQSGAVENKPVIVLDAGHGGMDGGAVSGGIRESEINLAIAEKARKMLTLLGYRVVMTRETDTLLADENAKTVRQQKRSDLENRLKIMAGTPGAVGVSIHQNHFFIKSSQTCADIGYCCRFSYSTFSGCYNNHFAHITILPLGFDVSLFLSA